MFAYARAAIDFWPGWISERDFKGHLVNAYLSASDAARALEQYQAFYEAGQELAKKIGWEGDMREGPYIAGLPTSDTGDDGHFMIAWKQDNNGDTFIVSPYRIPWLEQGDYGKWIEG